MTKPDLLESLVECASGWVPEARLLGNITARDILWLMTDLRRLREQEKKAVSARRKPEVPRALRVEVTPGEVVLENVSVLADTKDLVVVYIDTQSKYPGILGVSDVELMIEATKETLRGDCTKKGEATRVRLYGLRGKWHQAYDVGRYSITWVFYRFGKTCRLLWDNLGLSSETEEGKSDRG